MCASSRQGGTEANTGCFCCLAWGKREGCLHFTALLAELVLHQRVVELDSTSPKRGPSLTEPTERTISSTGFGQVVVELLRLRQKVLKMDPKLARGMSAAPKTEDGEEVQVSTKGSSKPLDIWDHPSVEGKPVSMADMAEWLAQPMYIPFEGFLTVNIRWHAAIPEEPTPMHPMLFKHIHDQLTAPSAQVSRFSSLPRRLHTDAYMTLLLVKHGPHVPPLRARERAKPHWESWLSTNPVANPPLPCRVYRCPFVTRTVIHPEKAIRTRARPSLTSGLSISISPDLGRDVRAYVPQDKWRGTFIRLVVEVTPITAHEAGEMLRCMDWGTERMEVCMDVYGRILDHENMHLVLAPLLPPERIAVIKRLGPQLLLWNRRNMCGHYTFNLHRQQDRWIAQALLDECLREGVWRKQPMKHNLYVRESNLLRSSLPSRPDMPTTEPRAERRAARTGDGFQN